METVSYADIFDYPLALGELHRYLIRVAAPFDRLVATLRRSPRLGRWLGQSGHYVTLAGREAIVAIRRRREEQATRLWPKALHYGRAMASLPFVRMVAVTGALAMDNTESDADIDYLVVARPGRVWTCRAFVTAQARFAARRGHHLCPNYVLSEDTLAQPERNVYVAHELAQMVPVSGLPIYERMRAANPWVAEFLPNATGLPRSTTVAEPTRLAWAAMAESTLSTKLGVAIDRRLQRWQVARLRRKIERKELGDLEITFAPETFKGHYDGHGQRILRQLADRLQAVERTAP
ncbi:MAG: hypothetical protein ACM3O7_08715 [Acidobacteriota bacterium]